MTLLLCGGGDSNPSKILFVNSTAVNPGILRPNWYGNCVATYGLQSVIFRQLTCKAPSLTKPIPQPQSGEIAIDTSMFVFYTSFGGSYPSNNSVRIEGWSFEDLSGQSYRAGEARWCGARLRMASQRPSSCQIRSSR